MYVRCPCLGVYVCVCVYTHTNTVEPAYNDIGLKDTSSIMSDVLRYQ
jgi:hypothetical protein